MPRSTPRSRNSGVVADLSKMAARAWREAEHPRRPAGPGGGQFVTAGWAAIASARTLFKAKPVRGRDLSNELDFAKIAKRLREDKSTYGDTALGDIYEQQGFHGRPTVATAQEMDALVAAGHKQLFRGIADADLQGPLAGVTGADFAQQFRLGDEHYPGFGFHGNGTYVTDWQLEAQGYSDPHDEKFRDPQYRDLKYWPGVVRMTLPPDARVVELQRLKGQQHEAINRASRREDWDRYAVIVDLGRYAAMLGYDAISLGPLTTRGTLLPDAPPSREHYILLNRSILTVQEAAS